MNSHYISIRVKRDFQNTAELIAPIIGTRPWVLTRRLKRGPFIAGPYSRKDAWEIASAVQCFGASCMVDSRQASPPGPRRASSRWPSVRRPVRRARRRG